MKIILFLTLFVIFLFSKDFDYHLKPIKITENSYYFYGKKEYFSVENGSNIANSAFIVTKNSVIVIDTGSSYQYAKQMIDEIKKITKNPIKFVINTHHHPDHFLGNDAFSNAKIYATKFTTDDIEKNAQGYIENLSNISLDAINGTKGLAPNTLLKDTYLNLDGYKLKILYLKGHTEDDIAIYDENTKVLYPSDLVFYDRTPATPHSNIKEWINSLEILRKIDYKYILPGHGELSTSKAPIDETINYLTFVDELFKNSAKKGLNVYEILNQDIPKKFKNLKMFDEEFQRSTINLYPKYEQKAFK